MGDVTSALEQKWAQEEEGKTLLQKAYENVSKKKTDGEKLNPEKITPTLLEELPYSSLSWKGAN